MKSFILTISIITTTTTTTTTTTSITCPFRYKEAQKVAQETPGVDANALFRKQALWEQESGDKV
jgi:hypothetical protein